MVKLEYQGLCVGCNYGKFKFRTSYHVDEHGEEKQYIEIRCKHKEACERAFDLAINACANHGNN